MRISLLVRCLPACLLVAGCTEPDLSHSVSESPAPATAEDPALKDGSRLHVSGGTSLAQGTNDVAASPSTEQPTSTDDVALTSDSDEPRPYRAPSARDHEHKHEHAEPDPAERAKAREADGDDPTAPILIRQTEAAEEEILDDGRGGVTTPPPRPTGSLLADPAANEEPTANGRDDASPQPKRDQSQVASVKSFKAPARTGGDKRPTELPEAVRDLDEDKDGQIGLYEWPKTKIKQFTTLDANGDGFLTPQELLDAAIKESAGTDRKSDAQGKKSSGEVAEKPAAETTEEDKGSEDKPDD